MNTATCEIEEDTDIEEYYEEDSASELQINIIHHGFTLTPLSDRAVEWMMANEYISGEPIAPVKFNWILEDFANWNPEHWFEKLAQEAKIPKNWRHYEPSPFLANSIIKGSPPLPPVRITQDNFKDKSLSQQKWGFEVLARKRHRAFYGPDLNCKVGVKCKKESFYQVKWFSYNKTGKAGYAYGVKGNFKWACPDCADKWADKNLSKKDSEYKLPELPNYINPAWKCIQWDGPPTVYDDRFC